MSVTLELLEMAPQDYDRRYPDGTRIALLERSIIELREDIASLQANVKPLTDAFQQAKGFKGAIYVGGIIIVAALGASFSKVVGLILQVLKP